MKMAASSDTSSRDKLTVPLQKFLRDGGKLEQIEGKPYNLRLRRHGTYPNLVLFKYGISPDWSHPEVINARGIILDEDNDWEVVAYPYDKFFNYGDPIAAKVDFEDSIIYEKLDGSLMFMYWL